MQTILTTDNEKIHKSREFGFYTVGIHLAPASLSGYNVCKWASKGCRLACLNTAGMGAFSTVQKARIDKTKRFFEERESFMLQLCLEIGKAKTKAVRLGLKLAVRLNLTSDIAWEDISFGGYQNIFAAFPDICFYDYTKSIQRVLSNKLPNYSLTFSRSETSKNHFACEVALKNGSNVAIPFAVKKGEPLPENYLGLRVIDGDKHDLRFLDGKSVVIGLRAKGKARKDLTGFVVNV